MIYSIARSNRYTSIAFTLSLKRKFLMIVTTNLMVFCVTVASCRLMKFVCYQYIIVQCYWDHVHNCDEYFCLIQKGQFKISTLTSTRRPAARQPLSTFEFEIVLVFVEVPMEITCDEVDKDFPDKDVIFKVRLAFCSF